MRGILTSGKDFLLTSGMKSNSHQWDKKFIPLVRKKYFPLVRIFKKKNSHQWEDKGGNGGRGRNGEEEGGKGLFPMRLGQDLGPKAWRYDPRSGSNLIHFILGCSKEFVKNNSICI